MKKEIDLEAALEVILKTAKKKAKAKTTTAMDKKALALQTKQGADSLKQMKALNEHVKAGTGALWAIYHKLVKGEVGIKLIDYTDGNEDVEEKSGEITKGSDLPAYTPVGEYCGFCGAGEEDCVCGGKGDLTYCDECGELLGTCACLRSVCKGHCAWCGKTETLCTCSEGVNSHLCPDCGKNVNICNCKELADEANQSKLTESIMHPMPLQHDRRQAHYRKQLWLTLFRLKLSNKTWQQMAYALNNEGWLTSTGVIDVKWTGKAVCEEYRQALGIIALVEE